MFIGAGLDSGALKDAFKRPGRHHHQHPISETSIQHTTY